MKYIEAKRKLKEFNIEYREYDGKFIIYACNVGDNFYDYGEPCKPINFEKELEWIKGNSLFDIVECCDCCGCAGW